MARRIGFTCAQVRRAVKAAESCGLRVKRLTVAPDGAITVYSDEDNQPATSKSQPPLASWDDFRRDET
jgi:hypothetical protein